MGPPSTSHRRPPRPTAAALIGLALGIEIAFLLRSVGGGLADVELGERLFWFGVSLLLLLGIYRRSRACWAVYVVFELVAAAILFVAAADLVALALLAALLVQIAALMSPQVRAHVGGPGPTEDAAKQQVEPQDA
jgi:hypothetical protein